MQNGDLNMLSLHGRRHRAEGSRHFFITQQPAWRQHD